MTERRIYVACLASYNNGRLHGAWIDTEGMDADELSKEVQEKVLLNSPYPNVEVECPDCEGTGDTGSETCKRCKGTGKVPSAEEYAIHDHEGYPKGTIGEYTPLSEIAKIEEIMGELNEGEDEAFMAWLSDMGIDIKDANVDKFRDEYMGKYDSGKAFAEEYSLDTGAIKDDDPWFAYVDWEHYWNADLRHEFSWEDGHVFRRT